MSLKLDNYMKLNPSLNSKKSNSQLFRSKFNANLAERGNSTRLNLNQDVTTVAAGNLRFKFSPAQISFSIAPLRVVLVP